MKNKFIILFLFCSVQQLCFTQNIAWEKSSKEKQVDSLFSRWNLAESSGTVISIVEDGKIVYLQGYGSANLEHGISNHPQKTRFNIASISKQFTSFCILLLEREGKLTLDDDIRKYLPEIPDFGHTITLRHLATHTSGLRDQWNLLKLAGWRMDDVITNDHVFRLISRQKDLNFKPGEQFRYSNTGHTLLAEVVSRVSGMSFAEFARTKIFAPLGMNNSLFFDDHQMIVPNLADSYDGNLKGGFRKSIMCISSVGATNLYSTAEDMAKWAMNFDNPIVGDEEMIAKLNEVPMLNNGTKSNYALGQYMFNYKGILAYEHSGAEAAFESYFIRFPEHKFAVTLLANSGSFWAEGLGRKVADIYLGDFLKKESREEGLKAPNVTTIELQPEMLKVYCGDYWCENEGLQRGIKWENESLWYIRKNSATELKPIAPNRFIMKGVPAIVQISFERKTNGEYDMTFSDGRELLHFQSMQKIDLSPYEGRYYSEELDTYYHLKINKEVLVAHHQRIKHIELHPIRENTFHSTTWFFKNIQFERDKKDKVVAFYISNRGVSDLRFQKL